MTDSTRTARASKMTSIHARSLVARAAVVSALVAAALSPARSMAERPRQSGPEVRVSAGSPQVTNGNPSFIRATTLRSYSALQQCGALLPRGASPLVVSSAVRLTIPVAGQAVTANVQSTTNAPGSNAPPFVAALRAFDSCAQRSIIQLPWQRPARGATEARWSYTVQRAALQGTDPQPQPPPTQYSVSADPAQVTNGNPSYIRATILRSYAPLQQCAAQLPRVQNPTPVRVDARLSITSDAAQPVTVQAHATRNSDVALDASAFDTCALSALRQLSWQRPARGTTEASWSYTLQPQAASTPTR